MSLLASRLPLPSSSSRSFPSSLLLRCSQHNCSLSLLTRRSRSTSTREPQLQKLQLPAPKRRLNSYYSTGKIESASSLLPSSRSFTATTCTTPHHRTMSSSTATPSSSSSNTTDPIPSSNTSGITSASLSQTILSAPTLQASVADVEDISGGCGQSFAVVIVSPLFEGKMTLARHRLVNKALSAEIARIHAWTPKCFTPGEWEAKKEGGQGKKV